MSLELDDSPRGGGRPRTRARVIDYPLVDFWDEKETHYSVHATEVTSSAHGIAVRVFNRAYLDDVRAAIQHVDPSRVYSVRCDMVGILAHLLKMFPYTTEVIYKGTNLADIADRIAGLDRIESLQVYFPSDTPVLDTILRSHGRTIRTLQLYPLGPSRPCPELALCTGPLAHLDVQLTPSCSQDVRSLLARSAPTLKSLRLLVTDSRFQWFPVGHAFPHLSSLKFSWASDVWERGETTELNKLLDASPNLRLLDLTRGPSVDRVRVPASVVDLAISVCSAERMRVLLTDNPNRDVHGYAFDDEARRLSNERRVKLVGRIVEDVALPERPLGGIVAGYLKLEQ